MKAFLLLSLALFSFSSIANAVEKIDSPTIINGWADGLDCDAYALGAYYGYLNANHWDKIGATETSVAAYWDCIGGGGHSKNEMILHK